MRSMVAWKPSALMAPIIMLVAVLGIVHLAIPFYGDQALFAIGAQKMLHGASLYRDFWDLKQPAIYVFYLLGGSMFGFSPVGIHLFELLYLTAFGIVLAVTTRPYFARPVTAALVPLFVVGVYYANIVGADGMTQVEAIAGFPLYLALYFALRGFATRSARWFVFAGFAGAVALAFKLLFLPIVIAMWVAAYLSERVPRTAVPVLHGAALFVSLTLATAAWLVPTCIAGNPHVVYETFIFAPMWIAKTIPHAPIQRLASSSISYAISMLPLILLGAFGIWHNRRTLRSYPLQVCCIVWILAAGVVIVMQRQSWWGYQMQLFTVPVGILCAYGLEAAHGLRASQKAFAATLLLVASGSLARHLLVETRAFIGENFAIMPQAQERFATRIDPLDAARYSDAAFLRDTSARSDALYVFGSPVYYLGAHHVQPIAINGWSPEFLTPNEWLRLLDELKASSPVYLFIADEDRGLVARSVVGPIVRERYETIRSGLDGTWLKRRDSVAGIHNAPR